MSGDDLLKALGRLERERRAAEPAHLPATDPGVDRILARLEAPAAARRRPWRGLAVALGVAAAAALAFWLLAPEERSQALAAYELRITGGDAPLRGTDDAAPPVTTASFVVLTLRPASAVTADVGVRVFVRDDGRLRPVDAPVERSPEGALRLAGPVATLLAPRPGDYEVVAVVAPTPELPRSPDDVAAALGEPGRHRDWQVLRAPLVVHPSP
jgi:hypothetical protein